MALIIKDRVKEGTVTTGTGAYALGGASSTFEAFNTYMSNGDTAYYAVVHTASGHDEWEVGLGTWNTGNTLTRTTILSSSNSGNAVSFSSGTKDIFMTYPADRAVIEEPDRSVAFPAGISVTGNVTASGTIDGRDVAADGTKLDGIETAATADQTKSDIDALNINADTLDGVHASALATSAQGAKADAALPKAGGTMSGNIDGNGNKVLFANVYSTEGDLPSASTYHGMFVHVHSTGAGYFAHAGNWVKLANDSQISDENFTTADHSKLDGIEPGATADQTKADIEGLGIDVPATNLTGTIPAARLSTATTQAESDDSTKIATTAYVTDKITTLIGGAPSTLNDLNELAAAINDDANYNSTLTTALATKLPKAGGTMTGDVLYGDNVKAKFGAGSDLQIYHDGSNSEIINNTGVLNIKNDDIRLKTSGDETSLRAVANGAVELMHNNATKLATTSTGIDVTGVITTDGMTTSADINFGDSDRAIFGAGSDLRIYHDGNNSYIEDVGDGILSIDTNGSMIQLVSDGSGANGKMADFKKDGAVNLYYDNALKLATTSTGVDVTGNVTVSGTVDGRDVASDGTKLDGIEANAKNDQTITAGSGLSGGGTGDVTLSHADTSSVSNSDNSGNTFIQDITFDTYGHVQSVGTGTVSVGNGTLTVQGTGALGGSGTFTANQSGNATISISHDDTSSQASSNNSGRTYIQDVTLDAYGHVTGLATATETVVNTDTTYSVGDGGLTQKNFTSTLKTKLDGIASGATANVGDITGVTAGSGISGGGTSGTVTVSHADTSNLNGNYGISGNTGGNVVQSFVITSDTYGHVTNLTSASTNLDNRYTKPNTTVTFTTVNAGTFNTTSDERAKEDITPITGALDKVQQLGGYSFTLKATDEKSSGVIAQEVQKVIPELVQEDDEGLLSVQYGNMVGLLIEAIKEQQTQIDELKEKLNS